MKKIITKILVFTILCSAIIAMPSEAMASEVNDKEEIVSLFTDEDESSAVVYTYLASTLRGVYLLEGTALITRPFTGIAGCAGSTTANFAVSVVGITVTLERYVNGSWSSVDAWSAAKYNAYYVNLSQTKAVTGGYYYRVKTAHVAGSDTTMTATSGIWFS